MIIDLNGHTLTVRREVTDPRFYNDDSRFLYRLKNALRLKGYDCVKKLAWKDGHLVDNTMHYIRHRKGDWCLWDTHHAVRSLARAFDTDGKVTLRYQEGTKHET